MRRHGGRVFELGGGWHLRTAQASAGRGERHGEGALPCSGLAEPPDDGARFRRGDPRADLATDVGRCRRPEESGPRWLGVEVRYDRIVVEEPVPSTGREGCELPVHPETPRRRPVLALDIGVEEDDHAPVLELVLPAACRSDAAEARQAIPEAAL